MAGKQGCSLVKIVAGTSMSESLRSDIDWSLCCLCQSETRDKLVCPADSKKDDVSAGYRTLAENLSSFRELGEIPSNLKLMRLDKGEGVESILVSNHARFHKVCKEKYNQIKLQRLQKRRSAETASETGDDPEESGAKRTRSTLDTTHVMKETRRFICDELSTMEELSEARPTNLDSHVRECAAQLNDSKLLAKLSRGDVIAIEAKYHKKCLVALYNRLRSQQRERKERSKTISHDDIKSSVLAELI